MLLLFNLSSIFKFICLQAKAKAEKKTMRNLLFIYCVRNRNIICVCVRCECMLFLFNIYWQLWIVYRIMEFQEEMYGFCSVRNSELSRCCFIYIFFFFILSMKGFMNVWVHRSICNRKSSSSIWLHNKSLWNIYFFLWFPSRFSFYFGCYPFQRYSIQFYFDLFHFHLAFIRFIVHFLIPFIFQVFIICKFQNQIVENLKIIFIIVNKMNFYCMLLNFE